eukprot:TRINITY_DN1565_c0_g1_i1.p1 TRINITY_DN1565_c0_g1~~TRINITY_DN1565_c0_g1_i1.p1  ORF type:complete len:417 (-),score=102.12 TRINITY_DN1565_c0_g1_i1:34-1284(-)
MTFPQHFIEAQLLPDLDTFEENDFLIAFAGCVHGHWDNVYEQVLNAEFALQKEIDILIVTGDGTTIRNIYDINSHKCPSKYQAFGDFYKYYNGTTIAPKLTILIGGNHEASNCLWENFFGGYIAPNIYYLGHTGCLNLYGNRIVGLSGIYHDFGHFKKFRGISKSNLVYGHQIRQYSVELLMKFGEYLKSLNDRNGDVKAYICHDWPTLIQEEERYVNPEQYKLMKRLNKRFMTPGQLQAFVHNDIIDNLDPDLCVCSHMHFTAKIDLKLRSGKTSILNALCKCCDDRIPRGAYYGLSIQKWKKTSDAKIEFDPYWAGMLKKFGNLIPFQHWNSNKDTFKRITLGNIRPNEIEPLIIEIPEFNKYVEELFEPLPEKFLHYPIRLTESPSTVQICRLLEIDFNLFAGLISKDDIIEF